MEPIEIERKLNEADAALTNLDVPPDVPYGEVLEKCIQGAREMIDAGRNIAMRAQPPHVPE